MLKDRVERSYRKIVSKNRVEKIVSKDRVERSCRNIMSKYHVKRSCRKIMSKDCVERLSSKVLVSIPTHVWHTFKKSKNSSLIIMEYKKNCDCK